MMKSIKDIPWECGKGWWPMIEKVASAIDSFNAAHPDSPVEVSQIKQKFGGLRIYHYNAPEDIRQLIDLAIESSWHTCERCAPRKASPPTWKVTGSPSARNAERKSNRGYL